MFSLTELFLSAIQAAVVTVCTLILFVEPSNSKRAVSGFSDADIATGDLRAISRKTKSHTKNDNATVLLVGDRNSGKTTFINKYNYYGEGKVNFKEVPAADKNQISAYACQSSVKAAVVMCESTNPDSASEWKKLLDLAVPGIPVILVATKTDLLADNVQGFMLGAAMHRISKASSFARWFIVMEDAAVREAVDFVVSAADIKNNATECEAIDEEDNHFNQVDENVESCWPKKPTPENGDGRRRRLRSRRSLDFSSCVMGEI